MKIVFFGTPDYVVPIAEALYRKFGKGPDGVAAVVTQPPRPMDREKYLKRTAIDNWAYKRKIPIFFSAQEAPEATLGVLASYGEMIPQEVINRFGSGILNIHPSLLPNFRGAAPVQAAITTNTNPTGVTVTKMDQEMDHGPVISSFKEEILPTDTTLTLRNRLFERSADFLIELLPNYLNGKVKPKDQNHDQATTTSLVKKAHGYVTPQIIANCLEGKPSEEKLEIGFIKNFSVTPTPEVIERLVRALSPWPNVWTRVNIGANPKRLIILSTHLEDGRLILDEVQLEGKNKVSFRQLREGYPALKFA